MKLGVIFPNRRQGLIHVRGRLRLPPLGTPLLTLSFPSEALQACIRQETQLPALARSVYWALMAALLVMAQRPVPPRWRRRVLTIPGRYDAPEDRLRYTITIARADLEMLQHEPPPRVWVTIARLLMQHDLASFVRTGQRPRGARVRAPEMLMIVRVALVEAGRLCAMAFSDVGLRAELTRVLGPRYAPQVRLVRRHALLLVDRAFLGAWDDHEIVGPAARMDQDGDPPRAVYHALFQRDSHAAIRAQYRHLTPSQFTLVHNTWLELLLAEPGQAAREFKLI